MNIINCTKPANDILRAIAGAKYGLTPLEIQRALREHPEDVRFVLGFLEGDGLVMRCGGQYRATKKGRNWRAIDGGHYSAAETRCGRCWHHSSDNGGWCYMLERQPGGPCALFATDTSRANHPYRNSRRRPSALDVAFLVAGCFESEDR